MYSFPPINAAISALFTIVDGLATALGSVPLAIVVVTMLVRVLLLPLGWFQARADVVRTRMAPQVKDLQRRHKHNPERLHHDLADLYAREGTSPLAGCLPSLAQAPFLAGLYGLFNTPSIGGGANTLLTETLGSVPLGMHLIAASTGAAVVVFATLLLMLAVVAWLSSRRLPASATGPLRYAPFATVAVATFVPLAAGIYLLTSSAWTLAERTVLRRYISAQ